MDNHRELAYQRLQRKRSARTHLAVYLIVNVMLVAIWALSGGGYFWPVWPILGWGIGLAFHWWGAYMVKPIPEEEVRREMERVG